jgi:hypothetical protein
VDGYTKILLGSYGALTDEQLSRFKDVAERELGVGVSFSRPHEDYVTMAVEIPSVDPDKCIKILKELERLEV